jgi:hypothetical protein
MGELAIERRVQAFIRDNPDVSDKELMEKSGI